MKHQLADLPCTRDHLFARLRRASFVPGMDAFFLSNKYLILLGLLTVAGNAFSLELPVYGIFAAIAVYLCLFGRDLLPLIPILICCYIVPSRDSNPGIYEDSFFYGPGGMAIAVMAALMVLGVLLRLALDPELGQMALLKTKRALLPGLVAVGITYVIGGIGSGHYFDRGTANLVFGIVQFLAIALLYFILTAAVRWNEAPKHYFSRVCLTWGCILLVELAVMYLQARPFVDGELNRNVLFTGWGNYNCMGALLTMMIPFAFHLGTVRKPTWLYSNVAALFLVGVILTCSRTSLVIAVVTYVVCLVYLMIKSSRRWSCVAVNAISFGGALAYLLIFHYDLFLEYLDIFTITRSVNSRLDGFEAGIAQFLDAPILGGGFFPVDYPLEIWSTVDAVTSFFPAFWHNTIIQLLATCGIVGLAVYCWHRWQTVRLLIKKPTIQNVYIFLSIAAMLAMSMFDCHLFKVAPTVVYSIALAFAEKQENCE